MFVTELKRFDRELQKKTEQMTQCPEDSDAIKLIKEQSDALNQLKYFIVAESWARESTKEKLLYFMKHSFNYELTAERFKTTPQCIRVFIHRQNERLEQLLGGVLSLIEQGEVESGLVELYSKSSRLNIERELDYSIAALLPSCDKKTVYILEDCGKELEFLANHLRTAVSNELSAVNSDKLTYLLDLLSDQSAASHATRSEALRLLYFHKGRREKTAEKNGSI